MKHARADYDRIQDPAGLIPADEPVFLLRAQDELACKAVAYYASLCEQAQAAEVAAKARAHSDLMAAWPKKKVPDLKAGVPTNAVTDPQTPAAVTSEGLTEAQRAYLESVPVYCRTELAAYLKAGADVIVTRQREVVDEPGFAIVVQGTDFWIGCCNTDAEARELAGRLGLRVLA